MIDTIILAAIAVLLMIAVFLLYTIAAVLDRWHDEMRVFQAIANSHLAKIAQAGRAIEDEIEAERMRDLRRRFD